MELAKGQGNATFREDPVKEFDTWDVDLWSSSSFSVLFDSPPSSRRLRASSSCRKVDAKTLAGAPRHILLLPTGSSSRAKHEPSENVVLHHGESTDATKVPTCLLDPSWLFDTPSGARIQHEPCFGRIA